MGGGFFGEGIGNGDNKNNGGDGSGGGLLGGIEDNQQPRPAASSSSNDKEAGGNDQGQKSNAPGHPDNNASIMERLFGSGGGAGAGPSGGQAGGTGTAEGRGGGVQRGGVGDGGGGSGDGGAVAGGGGGGAAAAGGGGFPGGGLFSFMAPGNSISTIDKFTEVREEMVRTIRAGSIGEGWRGQCLTAGVSCDVWCSLVVACFIQPCLDVDRVAQGRHKKEAGSRDPFCRPRPSRLFAATKASTSATRLRFSRLR